MAKGGKGSKNISIIGGGGISAPSTSGKDAKNILSSPIETRLTYSMPRTEKAFQKSDRLVALRDALESAKKGTVISFNKGDKVEIYEKGDNIKASVKGQDGNYHTQEMGTWTHWTVEPVKNKGKVEGYALVKSNPQPANIGFVNTINTMKSAWGTGGGDEKLLSVFNEKKKRFS